MKLKILLILMAFFNLASMASICSQVKKYIDKKNVNVPWSTDFIVKTVLEIERKESCPKEHAEFLKKIYLTRFSISAKNNQETDYFFRALIMSEDEAAKVRKLIPKNKEGSDIIKILYGNVSELKGVVLINPSRIQLKNVIEAISRLCPQEECPFWNTKVLYKAIIINENVAAFIPETATLVLSKDIVTSDKVLDKIILVHELSHVAIEYSKLKNLDWVKKFMMFSGWHLKKKMHTFVAKVDSKESFGSQMDHTILKVKISGQEFDGFVFEKTYWSSLKRNDTSEDLADHIAAFIYMPHRFCFDSIPVALQKYNWISYEIFGKEPKLSCPYKEKNE